MIRIENLTVQFGGVKPIDGLTVTLDKAIVFTVALSQKVRDVLKQKEVEVRDSIYNGKQEEE